MATRKGGGQGGWQTGGRAKDRTRGRAGGSGGKSHYLTILGYVVCISLAYYAPTGTLAHAACL